jgi:NAD(P)-dependent dehydrogenase (short-subunit alcohol dehydrogenase family)
VNLDGVVYGILALAPLMEEAGGGTIAVTSSNAGLDPFPIDPGYALTKHALIGLVESLAPALADRSINLVAVCPAGIDTQMCPPDFREMRLSEKRAFAAPSYVAQALMTVFTKGRSGEIWMCREQDGGYWIYHRPRLPETPPGGAEFWPAPTS